VAFHTSAKRLITVLAGVFDGCDPHAAGHKSTLAFDIFSDGCTAWGNDNLAAYFVTTYRLTRGMAKRPVHYAVSVSSLMTLRLLLLLLLLLPHCCTGEGGCTLWCLGCENIDENV
jgi:hypothetical protein